MLPQATKAGCAHNLIWHWQGTKNAQIRCAFDELATTPPELDPPSTAVARCFNETCASPSWACSRMSRVLVSGGGGWRDTFGYHLEQERCSLSMMAQLQERWEAHLEEA